jgi:hypothetical protein
MKELDFSGIMNGTVIINEDPLMEGRVGVWIPKLMPFSKKYEAPVINTETLDNSIINNQDPPSFEGDVLSVNYLWVRPLSRVQREKGKKHFSVNDNKIEEYEQEIETQTVGGNFCVPRIGQEVLIFFLDEDPKKGYYMPLSPTILGEVIEGKHVYNQDNWKDTKKKPNIEVIREYWNGNIIEIDTNENTNTFSIVFDDGSGSIGHRFRIEFNKDKSSMELSTKDGNSIFLDETNENIRIFTKNGHDCILDDKNKKIEVNTSGGIQFLLDDNSKSIKLLASEQFLAEIKKAIIDASVAEICGNSHPLIFGDVIHNWAVKHTHTGNLGLPTSPPVQPLVNDLSKKVSIS